MKTKLVKRHICDFCGKGMFQIPAMKRHEVGCTANPNRECRMCRMRREASSDEDGYNTLADLVALIDSYGPLAVCETTKEIEQQIRDFVGNCPACLLAGSRQSRCGLPFQIDWKEESANWLGEYGSRNEYYP